MFVLLQVRSFGAEADSVSSILKGIVSGPDSMLEKLLEVGEFQQATQLMTTVIKVLNQVSSQEHFSDSTEMGNRVEVGTENLCTLTQALNSYSSMNLNFGFCGLALRHADVFICIVFV